MAFPEADGPKFFYFYQGTVLQNDDPSKCGCIRANVPAIKTQTKWAFPVGGPGAGPQRGMFAVPPVESNVVIGFIQGDIDLPFYLCGPWAMPTGTSEVPRAASAEPVATVHRVAGFESDLFEWFVNDEKKKLVIRSKDLQEEIEIDLTDRSMKLKARNYFIIEAAGISLKAPGGTIDIGGRIVAKVPDPI